MSLQTSSFRSPEALRQMEDWAGRVRARSATPLEAVRVPTRFGETHVWRHGTGRDRPTTVILPGFRTCGLIWDLDDTLRHLAAEFDLCVVDVIGQPGLSAGLTPDIRGRGYGEWLLELLDGLKLDRVFLVGASFGGLLQFKLARVAPARIDACVMVNPVGLSGVSLAPSVMWESFRPLLRTTPQTVRRFVERIVFAGGEGVSAEAGALLQEYVLLAIAQHRHRGRYPYRLPDGEIRPLTMPLYLILGQNDRLIPPQVTAARAAAARLDVRRVTWLPRHGHGAEVSGVTAWAIRDCLRDAVKARL